MKGSAIVSGTERIDFNGVCQLGMGSREFIEVEWIVLGLGGVFIYFEDHNRVMGQMLTKARSSRR